MSKLSKAGTPELWKHGGSGMTYSHYGCRCELCKKANRERVSRRRKERQPGDNKNPMHGTASMYRNWNCRCDACRVAHANNCRTYWQNRKKNATMLAT